MNPRHRNNLPFVLGCSDMAVLAFYPHWRQSITIPFWHIHALTNALIQVGFIISFSSVSAHLF